MRPLSDRWTEEVTAAIAREADLPVPITDHETVLLMRVTHAGEQDILLHLRVTPEAVVLRTGAPERHDAELRCRFGTVARLCRRETTAGDAFRGGEIELVGDIAPLIGLDEVFDEVVWAMGTVEGTEWPRDRSRHESHT